MSRFVTCLTALVAFGWLVCACDGAAREPAADAGQDAPAGDVAAGGDAASDAGGEPDAGSDAGIEPAVCEIDGPFPGATAVDEHGVTWAAIPAGRCSMGCSPGDDLCFAAELPAHGVEMAAFEVTVTEITQAQYEAVIGTNPSTYPGCPECPVETVNWFEAKALCEGLGGRLLSEAEWEYAARGGTTTRFPCGDDPSCLEDIAWYLGNSETVIHPVGQKDANPFGLRDMLGNVWEWVEDCWHDDYSANAPADGSAWVEEDCTYRMVRGGCWGLEPVALRVTNRDGDYPDTYFLPAPGIRCARDQE